MGKQKRAITVWHLIASTLIILLLLLNCRFHIYAFHNNSEPVCIDHDYMVMTFNIDAYDSSNFNTSRQIGVLKLITQQHPDVLCFQELSFESLRKIKPQLDSIYGPCEVLKDGNNMWRLRFYSHYPMRNFRWYKCEGDIDTDDMTDEERSMVEQSQKQMNVMSAEFEIEPDRWVTVFSGHLRSSAYSTARRSMGKNDSWFKGISLYKRNYKIGKRIRDYEAENVRRFIDAERSDGKPVIVAGDLNDWNGSYCLNTLMGSKTSRSSKVPGSNDQLKDAWAEGGNGFGWTYFGWHLRLRLDHILYSDELELVDVKVIDSDLSDHKPLMAKFRFK